jgi:hypothetical protein
MLLIWAVTAANPVSASTNTLPTTCALGMNKRPTKAFLIGCLQPTASGPEQGRGKQPLWLSTVMRYHIQPKLRKLGIDKKVSWHTFRHTFSTMLKANGEDVKVVQELLRHASAKMTLDTYSQALTPAKRAAQSKVVSMIRPKSSCTVVVPPLLS